MFLYAICTAQFIKCYSKCSTRRQSGLHFNGEFAANMKLSEFASNTELLVSQVLLMSVKIRMRGLLSSAATSSNEMRQMLSGTPLICFVILILASLLMICRSIACMRQWMVGPRSPEVHFLSCLALLSWPFIRMYFWINFAVLWYDISICIFLSQWRAINNEIASVFPCEDWIFSAAAFLPFWTPASFSFFVGCSSANSCPTPAKRDSSI